MNDADTLAPSSRRRIIMLTGSAAAVAAVVLFVAVLPAEFNRDPTGLGRLTGIDALWAPKETVVAGSVATAAPAKSFPTPFRIDEVEIPLAIGGDLSRKDELEYKVRVRAGGSYIYSWSVAGIAEPDEFYTEFHGHTLASPGAMTVANYRKATGTADNGKLTAPFDGVHGWYFQNQSGKPVTVKLRLAGFYDLIPDGQPGNESGLHATPVR